MTIVNQVSSKYSTKNDLQPEQKLYFSHLAISKMTAAVFWLNSAAKIVDANSAVCSLTQYSLTELLSMTIYDLNLDLHEAQWFKFKQELEQEEFVTVESCHCTKKGQRFPVEFRITRADYQDEKYYCVWLQNITQQKQAIAMLQKNNATLKQTIEQRTAELTELNRQLNSKLIKAHQKLNQETNLDGHQVQFVSLVSHELKAPLNLISFTNSLLQRHATKLNQLEKQVYLDQIEDSVQQLNQLIDTMMLIGKAEANKLNCHPQKIDLEQFCHDLIARLRSYENSLPEIIFTSNGDCREIAVDPQLLQLILRNLLDNAIKYSAWDSTVQLILESKEQELIFQVKDRGIGIDQKDLPHLFEPFMRGQDLGQIPGNGLGLAIAKQLVDIHHGQIQIDSKLGFGTTVTVSLPLVKA